MTSSNVGGLRLDHAVLRAVGLADLAVQVEGQRVAGEEALEGVAELLTHDAVEDEVDGAVDQHQDVHQVAQVDVHVAPEVGVDGGDPGQHALRHLGDDEADDDADEHHGGAVVLAGLVVVVDDARDLVEEARAALLGLLHGDDEQRGEEGHEHAGQDLDDHAEQPAHELLVRGVRVRQLTLHDPEAGHVAVHAGPDVVHAVHEVVGHAGHHGGHHHHRHRQLGARHGAEAHGHGVLADEDVAEDGEGDGEPHGHVVAGDDEQVMEEDEVHPAARVLRRDAVGAGDDVEVDGHDGVRAHRQHVGDGQRRQDEVGGALHVLAGQHDDVQHVGHDAEHADDDGEVAVDLLVRLAEQLDGRGRAKVRQRRGLHRARLQVHLHRARGVVDVVDGSVHVCEVRHGGVRGGEGSCRLGRSEVSSSEVSGRQPWWWFCCCFALLSLPIL